jgi:hypothetical protein
MKPPIVAIVAGLRSRNAPTIIIRRRHPAASRNTAEELWPCAVPSTLNSPGSI